MWVSQEPAQRNSWKHGCTDPHACGQRLHRPTCPAKCTKHATACPLSYGGGLVFRRPKGKSRRQITMPAELVVAMQRQREVQAAEREQAGSAWQDLDLVFAQPDGSPIDPRRDSSSTRGRPAQT